MKLSKYLTLFFSLVLSFTIGTSLAVAQDISDQDVKSLQANLEKLVEIERQRASVEKELDRINNTAKLELKDVLPLTDFGSAGVALAQLGTNYSCDSDEGICKCTFSKDCQRMEKGLDCSATPVCGWFQCTCDWIGH